MHTTLLEIINFARARNIEIVSVRAPGLCFPSLSGGRYMGVEILGEEKVKGIVSYLNDCLGEYTATLSGTNAPLAISYCKSLDVKEVLVSRLDKVILGEVFKEQLPWDWDGKSIWGIKLIVTD